MSRTSAHAALREIAAKSKSITDQAERKALSWQAANAELTVLQDQHRKALDQLGVASKAATFAGGGDASGLGNVRSAYAPDGTGGDAALGLSGEQCKSLFDAAQNRLPMVVKAAGDPSITDSNLGPTGVPMQALPPVAFAREPSRVANLLNTSVTDRPTVEFYVSTGTHGAGPVAEAAVKPLSGITYTRQSVTATKLAVRANATEEALSDFQPFMSMLAEDMTLGIIDAENNALLNAVTSTTAAPTPWNFTGLLAAAGVLTLTPAATTDTILDGIEEATEVLRVGARFAEANALVMHPATFSRARRIKTSYGNYIAGDPLTEGPRTLWGLPCTLTTQIPQNEILVADFRQAAMLWYRAGLSVRINPYEGWENNAVGIIVEERLALGVTAPAAICVLTVT